MPSRVALLPLLLVALVACSSEGTGDKPSDQCAGEGCAPRGGCPSGFEIDPETFACVDRAAEDCPSGTAPMLGSLECQPIGWTSCAAPFSKNASGWGCAAPISPGCTNRTREAIGDPGCIEIGDCSAPFPPAGTTITVDASLATEDLSHKKSILNAALEAKPGDVIAVFPGTYTEDVDLARPSLTLVGKCAKEVIIQNPGDRRAGILVTAKGARVRGFTLKGHMTGVLVKGGGDVVAEEIAVIDNRYLGVYAAEPGSRLRLVKSRIDGVVADAGKFGWGASAQLGGAIDLEDVVISRATAHGVAVANKDSSAKLTRTIVRETRFDDAKGFAGGISVADNAALTIDGALVDDVHTVGVMASGALLDARNLVVDHVKVDGKGESGRGIQISKGGRAKIVDSQVGATDEAGILAIDPGTRLEIESTTVLGDRKAKDTLQAHGIRVAGGAALSLKKSALVSNLEIGLSIQDAGSTAEVDGLLVRDARARRDDGVDRLGVGIGVAWGGSLVLAHGTIMKNRAAGILVTRADGETSSHAEIKSTLVRGNVGDETGQFGRGVEVTNGASVTLEDSAIANNNQTSVIVGHAGSALVLRRSVVRDTQQKDGLFGHGVVGDAESTIVLDEAWLLRHPGVGLAVVSSGATIARSVIARSTVAVHVQGDAQLEVVRSVPAPPAPRAVSVSEDTRFVENQTRVGSGEIPVPSVIGEVERPPIQR